jgi:hypothetical protein
MLSIAVVVAEMRGRDGFHRLYITGCLGQYCVHSHQERLVSVPANEVVCLLYVISSKKSYFMQMES